MRNKTEREMTYEQQFGMIGVRSIIKALAEAGIDYSILSKEWKNDFKIIKQISLDDFIKVNDDRCELITVALFENKEPTISFDAFGWHIRTYNYNDGCAIARAAIYDRAKEKEGCEA